MFERKKKNKTIIIDKLENLLEKDLKIDDPSDVEYGHPHIKPNTP